MKKIYQLAIIIGLITSNSIFSQTGNFRIGADLTNRFNSQGGLYDYSDPNSVNIKVAVWGFVKFPGRYIIPEYSDLKELISFAGGPSDDARLEDIRLYRVNSDSTEQLFKFSYNDLLWEENLKKVDRNIPKIEAGDVLVIPGEPRLYFSEYFSMTLSVVSTLISLSILILNIARK
jgi:hypothetical protein